MSFIDHLLCFSIGILRWHSDWCAERLYMTVFSGNTLWVTCLILLSLLQGDEGSTLNNKLLLQDGGPMAHPVRPHSYIKLCRLNCSFFYRYAYTFFMLSAAHMYFIFAKQMDNFYTGKSIIFPLCYPIRSILARVMLWYWLQFFLVFANGIRNSSLNSHGKFFDLRNSLLLFLVKVMMIFTSTRWWLLFVETGL